jgi:cytochrome c biogenesis protein CcdA
MITTALSVFGAGLLSSLSPCVYPMIPITTGYLGLNVNGQHQKLKVFLFFLGQVITFTLIGLVAVKFGEIFGFTSQSDLINQIIGILFFVFGLFSIFNYVPAFFSKLNTSSFADKFKTNTYFFPLIVGGSTALVASPCSSPILGSVLTTLAQSGNYVVGTLLMLSYSVGASLIFLIVGLGLVRLKSIPKAGAWMNVFHKISGFIILAVGLYYLYIGFIDN